MDYCTMYIEAKINLLTKFNESSLLHRQNTGHKTDFQKNIEIMVRSFGA